MHISPSSFSLSFSVFSSIFFFSCLFPPQFVRVVNDNSKSATVSSNYKTDRQNVLNWRQRLQKINYYLTHYFNTYNYCCFFLIALPLPPPPPPKVLHTKQNKQKKPQHRSHLELFFKSILNCRLVTISDVLFIHLLNISISQYKCHFYVWGVNVKWQPEAYFQLKK